MHESGICHKCAGGKWIIIGILILLNAVLPGTTGNPPFVSWGIFFGVIIILKGIVCMAKPTCGHVPTEAKGKSKK